MTGDESSLCIFQYNPEMKCQILQQKSLQDHKVTIFRHIHKTVKSNYQLHHVCLYTRNNSAPKASIFMKINI